MQCALFFWLQSPESRELAREIEEGAAVDPALLNHYTIITKGLGDHNYTQVPCVGLGSS